MDQRLGPTSVPDPIYMLRKRIMIAPAADPPRFGEGLATLSADRDLLLCDVWGVIHNGVRYFEPAVDALCRFRQHGGTVILVTNAPVPEAQVRARLDHLGVTRDSVPPYDRVTTAGDVAVDLIVDAGCPPIFNIGPRDDVAIYAEAARRGPQTPPHVRIADAGFAVCTGLDATGERPEDYDDILAEMQQRGLTLICANPDIVVEVGNQLEYCAGAIAERYSARGGTVIQTGETISGHLRARGRHGAGDQGGDAALRRMLAIGDAVSTDVAGAADQGIAALFITAGIHRAQLHRSGDLELDEAAPRPNFSRDSGAQPFAASAQLIW